MVLILFDRYMLFTTENSEKKVEDGIDEYGDSFARDVGVNELQEVRFYTVMREPF